MRVVNDRTRNRLAPLLSCLLVLFTSAFSLRAQGKGQGAIVVRNTERDGPAPIYRSEDDDKIEARAVRGDYVGGITTMGMVHQYQFERKENGRVHVLYFGNAKQSGVQRTAWMDSSDLETFTYDCGCGFGRHRRGREEEACSPLALDGFVSRTWNACFQEARDKKLTELKTRWAQEVAGASRNEAKAEPAAEARSATKSSEKPLTNDDVLAMVKAGLGDELTIAKIKQAPDVKLDVSTDELIRMKTKGASKAVIDAMMKRAAQAKAK